MSNPFATLLNKLTMYQLMLHFLRILIGVAALLSLFGLLPYPWWHILANYVLFSVFCWGVNFALAKSFVAKPNHESQYITAEILTLIVGPLNPLGFWPIILLISALAMASKYLLAYKKKHLFNPAAFGVLVAALLVGQGASWWVGGRYMLPFVIIGGLLVLKKLRWFHLPLSFLGAYLAALVASLLLQGAAWPTIWLSLQSTVLYSALIFFSVVMLVEPLTAPRGRTRRIIYGAGIGILIVIMQALWPSYGYGIETSLLVGNLLAFLASGGSSRQVLKLVEKTTEAKDTYSFWFEPLKKFDFLPGQYLEWTLAHPKHDSRGLRRYFTIAASPTENRLRIATKVISQSSTFKKALLNMNLGDEIIATDLEGDFILPKDNKKLAFVAGGIGVTPFLSMVKYLLDTGQKRDAILLYMNKTSADIGFKDLFAQAQSIGLKTVYVVTEPEPGWTGPTGFLTPELVQAQIPDWKDRQFFISGPEPMVENYEKMFAQMGLPDQQMKRDYFPGYPAQ